MTEGPHPGSLIAGCKRQDSASQLALYRLYYSYGMSICLRYAGSRESAQEMLNDAFLHVFLKIDQYRTDKPFKPWLRQIIVHAAIDHFRKYQPAVPDPELPPAPADHSYNEALDRLAYEDLLPLIQGLPDAYRLVFNLYLVEGLSHHQIAEKLGISIGTSKSNLAKARQKLKTAIAENTGIAHKSNKYG